MVYFCRACVDTKPKSRSEKRVRGEKSQEHLRENYIQIQKEMPKGNLVPITKIKTYIFINSHIKDTYIDYTSVT